MKEKRLSMLLLVALALATSGVLAAAPETAAAKFGGTATRTGWLGNTFRGGDRNKGRWVQLDIDDIFVFPDGRVVADTVWDEAGRAIGFYKDGDVIGKVDDYTALTGGLAVTADDQYIFALRLERKLGESDPMWHGVARYTLEGKPAKWPGAEGRVRNVLFLHPPSDKGGKSLTGVAARDGELFLADPISRMVKVYGTADMTAKREFKLNPETDTPHKMVFDKSGRLWIGQKGNEGKWRLRTYDARAGAYANLEIPDPGEPVGLALAPDSRLAVADNGPRQQVRFYAVDGAAVLKGTLGVEGGVYAGPNPGYVSPDRFGGLTGVGLDHRGNINGATWDAAWDAMLEFRYRTSERFEKALYAHIKSINPRATVDYNYHGNPPFSFEVGQRPVQHAGNSDFVTGETGVWGFSALTVGLNAEFYRAAVPHQRVQVAMQRGVRMYHDQTTRPLNDIRWELLTLLAHGSFVTVVDKTGFDGWLDPVTYERIGAAFEDARQKRAHFGQTPVQDVGIYYSSRTRDWVGREKPANYFQSFQGAHKAMVYEHIPYGVVLEENATLATLQRFPILMLPNVGILSGKEVALFRRYVEEGGKLLVTGQSGLFDRLGQPLAESALSELIGANVKGRLESVDNWVTLSGSGPMLSRSSADIRTNWPFLVKGPAVVYEPTTATPLGKLLKPHRTTRQQEGKEGTDWPMSADVPVGPAMLLHAVGRGTVLTFAGSPDFATASEHHIVEARRLLRNAVRLLHPTPRVEITAPAHVETVVTDDAANRTLRIHLLGYNSPPQTTPPKDRPFVLPMPIEDAPMCRVVIESNHPLKRAEAGNKSSVLKRRGQRVEVTVNDVHEVVVLRY